MAEKRSRKPADERQQLRRVNEALRHSEERLRKLTESANDAIVSADEQGRIISWNPAAALLFGHTSEEVMGRPLTLLMPERYRQAHEKGLERLRTTGEARLLGRTVELEGLGRDGVEFPVELSLAAWQTEEGRFYTGIIRSISERHQLERARIETELIADLNRRKDEFLAMLSHELRNPLAPIVSALHLLRTEDTTDPVRRRAQAIVERQVHHLIRLVDDLLEVSRITTGKIRLQLDDLDARVVVERAAESVLPSGHRRKPALSLSLPAQPVWLRADASRLDQVVVNLLTNALKYTDDAGRIRLLLRVEGAEAVLRVQDTGIGIAPEVLPRIFDLFAQAERPPDRSQGGLGVGLTIVQRIVEMHGGRVSASSAGVGRGSEFTVRLPLAAGPSHREPRVPDGRLERQPEALRVLVVDDNKDAADGLTLLLRMWGHDVRTSYDGPSALDTAAAFRPHAVLLDIGLPGMDGLAVARRLRTSPELGSVKLVAVTGYGRESDRREALAAGFDAHLVKPVEPQKIREILADLAEAPRG
jgi:PAS domain S-box-containing protein